MKKNLLIILAVAIVVGGSMYLFSRPRTSSAQTASIPDYLGTASEVFGALSTPTGATLDIGTGQGTVTVNNFYASNPPVDTAQYIVFKVTPNYYMDYDPTDSSFWIGVSAIPFTGSQSAAENDFLSTLGITQSQACELNVTEGVIYNASNPDDGMSFPLSFCGTSGQ